MKRVYADTSSIILLEKAGLLDWCGSVYPLIICSRVYNELTQNTHPGAERFKIDVKAERLTVINHCFKDHTHHLPGPVRQQLEKLDNGEKDLISLFLNKKNGFIMTDDGAAARFCFSQDIPFINALLVPKIFWYAGIININNCQKYMADLYRIGRYSEKVKAVAHGFGKSDLSFFLPEK